MSDTQVNPKFKDSLFRLIFREKKELLSLYNAMNGSDYRNPEDLVVNTLEDVVYMGIKNDVSFLFADHLNLYEAQSTVNPNMPLRGVFYFARLYKGIVEEQRLDIYSRKQLCLPKPVFVVFYNGTEDQEERKVLKLSESFSNQDCSPVSGRKDAALLFSDSFPLALECNAIMLNINYGHNRELMERCRKLEEYAFFVEQVRKHRAEVKDWILSEYNEELHIKNEKNISYEEGIKQGRQEGIRQGIIAMISVCREEKMEENRILETLMRNFSLSEKEAERYLND